MTNHRHRTAHCTRNTPIHRQSRHTARRYAHLRFCARVLRRDPNRPSLVDFLDVLVAFVAYFAFFSRASIPHSSSADGGCSLSTRRKKKRKQQSTDRQTDKIETLPRSLFWFPKLEIPPSSMVLSKRDIHITSHTHNNCASIATRASRRHRKRNRVRSAALCKMQHPCTSHVTDRLPHGHRLSLRHAIEYSPATFLSL
jgi:hypothetical protein